MRGTVIYLYQNKFYFNDHYCFVATKYQVDVIGGTEYCIVEHPLNNIINIRKNSTGNWSI